MSNITYLGNLKPNNLSEIEPGTPDLNNGITCPECGERTEVTDSRPKPGGIYRRRKCPQDHRFTTIEIIDDLTLFELRELLGDITLSEIKELRKVIKAIRKLV